MDLDDIPIGADFFEHIRAEIQHCDVVLALIGDGWLESIGTGGPRLDDPSDFFRLEIESALQGGDLMAQAAHDPDPGVPEPPRR